METIDKRAEGGQEWGQAIVRQRGQAPELKGPAICRDTLIHIDIFFRKKQPNS